MMASKILKCTFRALVALVLAVLTQVGALSYLLSFITSRIFKLKRISLVALLNLTLYGFLSFIAVPHLAPFFGRVPISMTDNLKPANYWLTVGLNRHYVVPELNALLQNISFDLAEAIPGAVTFFLDGSFPFVDKYPLLPHLSHNDGRKVDLSYLYMTRDGTLVNRVPSTSGYGYFEDPTEGEHDTNAFCKEHGYFQYDYPKYLTLGVESKGLLFSNAGNKVLLDILLSYESVSKVFIEPHLLDRLGLNDIRIRFHGCGAVRHDDHIHFQI